ncbi:MAG: DUF559 domain-containing protein [Chitinophagaceae bacterium]|nr:DUF559 domain-containing protein [Chitinophagaceae bacterium]
MGQVMISVDFSWLICDTDLQRESDLENVGCTIIRFTNDQVLKNLEFVLHKIQSFVENDLRNQTDN